MDADTIIERYAPVEFRRMYNRHQRLYSQLTGSVVDVDGAKRRARQNSDARPFTSYLGNLEQEIFGVHQEVNRFIESLEAIKSDDTVQEANNSISDAVSDARDLVGDMRIIEFLEKRLEDKADATSLERDIRDYPTTAEANTVREYANLTRDLVGHDGIVDTARNLARGERRDVAASSSGNTGQEVQSVPVPLLAGAVGVIGALGVAAWVYGD